MAVKKVLTQFRKENPTLFHVVWVNLGLAILAILGILLDTRQIGGINPWIKPLKFNLSVVIYSATVAWILRPLDRTFARSISLKTAICMMAEIILITFQAARGVRSHFNISHPMDQAIFSAMGVFIAYNTYLGVLLLLRYTRKPPRLPKISLRSTQYGLICLLVGNLFGGYMSSQTGHTVGGSDGGPGLPFLNWSLEHGDLRVVHFLGLHGLQLFLLLGWTLSRWKGTLTEKQSLTFLAAGCVCFMAILGYLFIRTMQGFSLI